MVVWRFLAPGGEEAGTSPRFEDQETAEAWLGVEWEGLVERGVEEVALEDDDGEERYRMALGAG